MADWTMNGTAGSPVSPLAQIHGGTGATSLGAALVTPTGGASDSLADHLAAKLTAAGGDGSAVLVTPTGGAAKTLAAFAAAPLAGLSAALDLNSQKITGLANGTLATDAAAVGQLSSASEVSIEGTGLLWTWTGTITKLGTLVNVQGQFSALAPGDIAALGSLPESVRPAAARIGFGTRTQLVQGLMVCRIDISAAGNISAEFALLSGTLQACPAGGQNIIVLNVTYFM